ncbi:MAG: DUF1254 domain-containing protein [Sphingomonadales bacterium]|nr:DUF1254 domain-containing protein [Sphingomonadales bacterium]
MAAGTDPADDRGGEVRNVLLAATVVAAVLPSAPASAAGERQLARIVRTVENGKVRDWRALNAALFRGQPPDLELVAARAYIWGMPLVAAARIREAFSAPPPQGQGTPINRFLHRRKLSGPEMRVGVGPNNDTIYSLAWLDLRDGPMVVKTPDFGSRYYTFSINQADSSSRQSLGQRTHGGQLPPLFVHGPGWHGHVPSGMVDVPVSTRSVNIAGRILVRGPEEYAAVHALQDAVTATRWRDWQQGRRDVLPEPGQALPLDEPDKPVPDGLRFLENLGQVIRDWDIRPEDREAVRAMARLGITPAGGFHAAAISPALREKVRSGLEAGRLLVQARSLNLGVQYNGWTINYQGPRFGSDFLLRAGVAKDQIFVALPEEAVYPVGRVDAVGERLDGHRCYAIRFAPGSPPPARAFWSITAYDDHGFMIPNPGNRYSVGDRSALVRADDGSITVTLSVRPPRPGAKVNWLPVDDAPFYVMMRLYEPSPSFVTGRWLPPAIRRQACDA